MPVPSSKVFDPHRLQILRESALLDAPPEEAFDRFTRLAARLLDVPISLVSLVDKDRQFFKSSLGLPPPLDVERQTPLSHSFCKHVVESGQPLIVPDARENPMLRDNPIIPVGVVAYAGFPLLTPEGLVLGSFCAIDSKPRDWTAEQLDLLRDLTAFLITEIQLRRTNKELQQTIDAKDQFIAMLSHDLRTPLNPALITAAFIAQDPSLPDSCREDAKLIQRNIELEVRMIDSMLDLTRISSGKLSLEKETVDLNALAAASMGLCRPDAAEKSIKLLPELQAIRSTLQGDPTKLLQVICNLLKNAIKFTPANGKVTLSSCDGDDGHVNLRVSDTGIGIEPARLAHIFNPFEQGSRNVTQQFGGLGLGLAIAKGIIEAHGGTIQAASGGANCGTCVTVSLPATAAAAKVQPPVAANPTAPGASLRILLVEDQEDSLRAMSRLLRHSNHQVITATCVSKALEVAGNENFDLLISDLGLPDGSGLQIMRELLTRRPVKGIALTGYGMESDIAESKQAGFQKHLTKPISFDDLDTAIRELI